MASISANGKFSYEKIYIDKSLNEWTINVHKYMTKELKWKYAPLKKGMFGYDNLIMSLAYVFEYCPNKLDINEVADYVHQGWTANYLYWKNNNPWSVNKFYMKPKNPLGDQRRNNCANTPFKFLPKEEKEKDLIIAKFLCDALTFS
ncbi:Hypothetical protein KVN_LOCUS81 [uncultured virus]|nr:Hypothetical protein KVN_LOCUS81 [uncultured virus]